MKCGKDNARAFVWSSLRELDLSFNYIKLLGESLVSVGDWERELRRGTCVWIYIIFVRVCNGKLNGGPV